MTNNDLPLSGVNKTQRDGDVDLAVNTARIRTECVRMWTGRFLLTQSTFRSL